MKKTYILLTGIFTLLVLLFAAPDYSLAADRKLANFGDDDVRVTTVKNSNDVSLIKKIYGRLYYLVALKYDDIVTNKRQVTTVLLDEEPKKFD